MNVIFARSHKSFDHVRKFIYIFFKKYMVLCMYASFNINICTLHLFKIYHKNALNNRSYNRMALAASST